MPAESLEALDAEGRSIAEAIANHLGPDALIYLFDQRRKTFDLVVGAG